MIEIRNSNGGKIDASNRIDKAIINQEHNKIPSNKQKDKNRITLNRNVIFLTGIFLIFAASVFAQQTLPTLISLQGKLTNTSTGVTIVTSDLRVNISDNSGATVWNETFASGVSNGFFDLLLGSSADNPLNLTFNQDYNISIYVGTSGTQIGGSYRFRSGIGGINPSNITAGNFSALGNFSFGSSLFVDKTNSRVGIGKTNPATALDVAGTVTATSYSGDGSALSGISSVTPPWNSSGNKVYLNDSTASLNITTNITLGNYPITPWQLIEEDVIDNQNESNFTRGIDSSFFIYKFIISGLVPQKDYAELYMRVSEDAGATWVASPDAYRWSLDGANTGAGNSSHNKIKLVAEPSNNNHLLSNKTGRASFYEIMMYNPAGNTVKGFTGDGGIHCPAACTGSQEFLYNSFAGGYNATTNPINGVQFFSNNTLLRNGTIRLYGIR